MPPQKKIAKRKSRVVIANDTKNSPSEHLAKKNKTLYILEHFNTNNAKTRKFVQEKMFPDQFSPEAFDTLFSQPFVYGWWLYASVSPQSPWTFEGPYVTFEDAKEDAEILVGSLARKLENPLKMKIAQNMSIQERTELLESELKQCSEQLTRVQKTLVGCFYRYDIRRAPEMKDLKSVLKEVLSEYVDDSEECDADIIDTIKEDDVVSINPIVTLDEE